MEIKIEENDIDTCHRLGPVIREKPRLSTVNIPYQVIYARFQSRSFVDDIMTNKKLLKKTGWSVFEELTPDNINLLKEVKTSGKVDFTWSMRGQILGSTSTKPKIKFDLHEDMDESIRKAPIGS